MLRAVLNNLHPVPVWSWCESLLIGRHWNVYVLVSMRKRRIWFHPCFHSSAQHVLIILLAWFVRLEAGGCAVIVLWSATSSVCSRQHVAFLCVSNRAFSLCVFIIVHVVHLCSCVHTTTGCKLFKTARSILVYFPSSLSPQRFVGVHVVHPYSSMDITTIRKKRRFILTEIFDFYKIDSLLIAFHVFVKLMLTFLSEDGWWEKVRKINSISMTWSSSSSSFRTKFYWI